MERNSSNETDEKSILQSEKAGYYSGTKGIKKNSKDIGKDKADLVIGNKRFSQYSPEECLKIKKEFDKGIVLTRKIKKDDKSEGIYGEMVLPTGQRFVTLERSYKDNRKDDSSIPPTDGENPYRAIISYSPRFKRDLVKFKNVAGRENILIHYGNTVKDSQGCILLGESIDKKSKTEKFISNSRKAVDTFMLTLRCFGVDKFSIFIREEQV